MNLRIVIDGGSKPNPGDSACAAVVYLDEHPIPIANRSKWLGVTTNNVAEHEGLILALETAIELNATAVTVESDSMVAVNHFNGGWSVNHPQLRWLVEKEKTLAKKLRKLKVVWVGRANVFPAHYLVEHEIEYRRTIAKLDGKKNVGKERIHADVSKFLKDYSIYVKQRTDFCFHTPKVAIVPLWECVGQGNYIYPSASIGHNRDIQLLNAETPVLLAWRPYGAGEGAKAPNLVESVRPLKPWWDGGTELMFCFADHYSEDELTPAFAGKRVNKFTPARDTVWTYD